jgi:hypothetical protein
MDSAHYDVKQDSDHDLLRPVHIVMNEEIAAYLTELQLNPSTGTNVFISPFGDVLVQGYPGDRTPVSNGVCEIHSVVKTLEDADIPYCMVAEPALLYYGTGRVMVVRISV